MECRLPARFPVVDFPRLPLRQQPLPKQLLGMAVVAWAGTELLERIIDSSATDILWNGDSGGGVPGLAEVSGGEGRVADGVGDGM